MKKLLSILLLLPLAYALMSLGLPTVVGGFCEYLNMYIRGSDSTWWSGGNLTSIRGSGSATIYQGVPAEVAYPAGVKFVSLAGGLHDGFAASSLASDTAFGYEIGANESGQRGDGTSTTQTTAYKLRYDSSGTLFDSIKQIHAGWNAVLAFPWYDAVKFNGSLWTWGNTSDGGEGNGSAGHTFTKPVQIFLAGGKLADSISCSDNCAILCTDHTVQTYSNDHGYAENNGRSGNNRIPADIGLTNIVQIATGYGFNYALTSTGAVKFWGRFGAYSGTGVTGFDPVATPIDITSALNLPAPVKQIVVNRSATVFILTNGEAWGLGGIACGLLGNGQNFYWPGFTIGGTTPYNGSTPAPYNWDFQYYNSSGDYSDYVQFTPIQICPGISDFILGYGGISYTMDFALERANGQYLQWGRDKGSVLATGANWVDSTRGHVQDSLPNALDINYPTVVNPFAVTTSQAITPLYCRLNPSVSPCSGITVPTRTTPVAVATSFTAAPGQIVLDGRASTAFYFYSRVWTCTSKPTGATVNMGIQTGATDTINLTTLGTYTFVDSVTDDVFQTSKATGTITIAASAQTAFYVDSLLGNDANPGTFASPLQSQAGVNALSLVAGDTVEYKAGYHYPGTLRLTASRIVMLPYGTGKTPIWGGMKTQTFSGSGPNYTATCSGCTANTNLFTLDDHIQVFGQTPNAPYQWYTFIPGSSSTTTLSDPTDLASAPAISRGGERSSNNTCDNFTVSSQTTSLLTFTGPVTYVGVGGNGWFYYSTPDTVGEWSYSGGTITCNGCSSGHVGKTAGVDTVAYITGSNNKISGINIHGANKVVVVINGRADSLVNDSLQYSGGDGIDGTGHRAYLSNLYIKDIQNNGITQTGTDSSWYILSPTIKNVGIWRGMGGNANAQTVAISAPGYGTVITNLVADSIGFNVIYTGGGDSTFIRKPSATNFNLNKTDGALVYFWINTTGTWTYGQWVDTVYAANGGNAKALIGTTSSNSSSSFAVYTDAKTHGVTVNGITSINMLSGGVQNHGSNNTFTNLLLSENGYAGFVNGSFSGAPITGVTLSNAQIYSTGSGTYDVVNTTFGTDITTMLTSNNNKFYHGTSSTAFFTKSSTDGGTGRSLASWTSNTGQDAGSAFTLQTLSTAGNGAQSAQTFYLGGTYQDLNGNYYYPTITLPKLSGILLKLKSIGIRFRVKSFQP